LLASGIFALREKIGPFLWQLPPTMPFDEERLGSFFALLPRTAEEAESRARRHDERVEGRTRLDVDPTRCRSRPSSRRVVRALRTVARDLLR